MPRIDLWVVLIINWAVIPVGLFALIHAGLQRADAYPAAGRLTKPAWLGITAGGTAALVLFSLYGAGTMFWLGGLVAVLVYIVDVRPKLIEVQRGPKW